MFFPISSPSVHLKQNRLCLREYWNTIILCIYRDRAPSEAPLFRCQSAWEGSGEKVFLSENAIKDTFRCLITIWSIGIAKRGLNEQIFVKTSNSTKIVRFQLFFFLPVAQNSPCAFTLILPAWVPYNVIKPQRSTKLSSFNDVQNAMPQKIRSACLHDSALAHIRFISDLFPHMNEAWIRSRYIRMHAFFSCLHCHRTDPICVTYEQKIGIGSHLTDSVNGALERQSLSEVKMERGSPICEGVRKKIVEYFKNNVPQRQIAKALLISLFTVHNIIKRFRETWEISVRKGQGRRLLLDACGLRALRRHCITHRHDSVIDITKWS